MIIRFTYALQFLFIVHRVYGSSYKLSRISGYLKHVEIAGFSGILSPFVLHWILVVVSRIRLHNLLLFTRWLM